MIVGQQKYINLSNVYNITIDEIMEYSGVSRPTVYKWLNGESVLITKHDLIADAVESIIVYRKTLK